MLKHIIFAVFLLQSCIKIGYCGYLEDVCLLPVDEGHVCAEGGSLAIIHHYFNSTLEECHRFEYKGCGGNNNRFSMQDDCTDACQVGWFMMKNKKSKGKSDSSSQTGHGPEFKGAYTGCSSPPDKGPCRAMISQWYYNETSKKCLEFNYGGCKGNMNRFDSEEQCRMACVK